MGVVVQATAPGAVEVPARRALAPALLYLAVRAIGTLIWWGMTAASDRVNWRPWDADWYLAIAEHGYATAGAGMVDAHGSPAPDGTYAFFPLYPLVTRAFAVVLGNYVVAGIAVSTIAGIAGAYGVARLARAMRGDHRAELIAVVLVAAAPMSVVYTLPYPEALLIALVVWTLVSLLEGRWWLVPWLVAAAGLANPMAGPLLVVVVVAACLAVFRERGETRWWAALSPLYAAAGMVGYLLWVSATAPHSYFTITEKGWGNNVDFGVTTTEWVFQELTMGTHAYLVVTAAAIIASVVAVVMVRRRMPWQVWLYTAGTVALIVVHSGLVQDRTRLLLSAFPLLVLAAVRLARCSTRVAVVTTCLIALAGLWFSAYSLSAWKYAI